MKDDSSLEFVPKERERTGETAVLQAPPPELPIDRALAGPPTARRHHRPTLARPPAPAQARACIYGREGLELALSTMCGWHEALAALVKPLVAAMWADARCALSLHRRHRRPGAGTGALPSWSLLGGDRPRARKCSHATIAYTTTS